MIETATLQATPLALALDRIRQGERCTVLSVGHGSCLCQLRCLGVVEGAELELVRAVSGGKLLILRVDGADVAVRRDVAATIQVRMRSHSDDES
jgi:Fe2+ transport system protein FeoA